MAYIFSAGVIKNHLNETVLKSTEPATIFVDENDLITILFSDKKEISFMLSDIQTINGQVPSDIGDAIDKLYDAFS